MNIAFLGCSKIARKIIDALNRIDGVVLYGCSARSFDRAKEFASKYGIKHAFTSYEEMLKDENIDLVYISTLSSSHFNDAMLTMKHNKSCIVEKPIATNSKDVKTLLEYSEKHNLYITEALMGRYQPSKKAIRDILESNEIGEPYHIEANLSHPLTKIERLNSLEMGGGVLLDLGVYPLNFVTMFFGFDIKNITSLQVIDRVTKVDRSDFITVVYNDNKTASLTVSMEGLSNKEAIIYCRNGYIKVDDFNNPKAINIYKNINDREVELIKTIFPDQNKNGYEYELISAINESKNFQIEADEFTHYEINKIYEIIDFINEKSIKVEN